MSKKSLVTFDDLLPGIITAIIGIIILLAGRHLRMFDQTSKNSIVATYSLGSIQGDMDDLKKQMREIREHVDKSHDNLIVLMEKRDEKLRDDFARLAQKVDDVNIRSQLNTSKIETIERKLEKERNSR